MSTIYDIAKAAQTSPASVSRVINGRGGVNAQTVQRIREAMDRHSFQPRWKAVDRNRLLIFTPDHKGALSGGYVSGIMSGIADSAFGFGLGLQLRPYSSQGKDLSDLRQLYMQEAASGCILISLYHGYSIPAKLDLTEVPHVVVGHKREDDDIHQVLLDDYDSGVKAANFLLELGHKRLAMVSFSHLDHGHHDRFRGFSDAVVQSGLAEPVCLQCDEANYEVGRSAARQLLSPRERPSAVIVTNEDIAAGFQAEARAMKLRIPDDLSLIAFEETDKLSLLDTPITAMQIPAYRMGLESVKILLSMIRPATRKKGGEYLTSHLSIPLIARRSTAAITP